MPRQRHIHLPHGNHDEGLYQFPWTPVPRGSVRAFLCIRKHTGLLRDRDIWPDPNIEIDANVDLSLDGGKTVYQSTGAQKMKGGRHTRPNKHGDHSEVPLERVGFNRLDILGIRNGIPVEQTDEMMIRAELVVRGGKLRSEAFFDIDDQVVVEEI